MNLPVITPSQMGPSATDVAIASGQVGRDALAQIIQNQQQANILKMQPAMQQAALQQALLKNELQRQVNQMYQPNVQSEIGLRQAQSVLPPSQAQLVNQQAIFEALKNKFASSAFGNGGSASAPISGGSAGSVSPGNMTSETQSFNNAASGNSVTPSLKLTPNQISSLQQKFGVGGGSQQIEQQNDGSPSSDQMNFVANNSQLFKRTNEINSNFGDPKKAMAANLFMPGYTQSIVSAINSKYPLADQEAQTTAGMQKQFADAATDAQQVKNIVGRMRDILSDIPQSQFYKPLNKISGLTNPQMQELMSLSSMMSPMLGHILHLPARAYTNQEMSFLTSAAGNPQNLLKPSLNFALDTLDKAADNAQNLNNNFSNYVGKTHTYMGFKYPGFDQNDAVNAQNNNQNQQAGTSALGNDIVNIRDPKGGIHQVYRSRLQDAMKKYPGTTVVQNG